jgi:hypothetical protein
MIMRLLKNTYLSLSGKGDKMRLRSIERQINSQEYDPELYRRAINEIARLGNERSVVFKWVEKVTPSLKLKKMPGILIRVPCVDSFNQLKSVSTVQEFRRRVGPTSEAYVDGSGDLHETYIVNNVETYRHIASSNIFYMTPNLDIYKVSSVYINRLCGYNWQSDADDINESNEDRIKYIQDNFDESYLLDDINTDSLIDLCGNYFGRVGLPSRSPEAQRFWELFEFDKNREIKDIVLNIFFEQNNKYIYDLCFQINKDLQEVVYGGKGGIFRRYRDENNKSKTGPIIEYIYPVSPLVATGECQLRNNYNNIVKGQTELFINRLINYDFLAIRIPKQKNLLSNIPINGMRLRPLREWPYYGLSGLDSLQDTEGLPPSSPSSWPLSWPLHEARSELVPLAISMDQPTQFQLSNAGNKIIKQAKIAYRKWAEDHNVKNPDFAIIDFGCNIGEDNSGKGLRYFCDIIITNNQDKTIALAYDVISSFDFVGVYDESISRVLVSLSQRADFTDPKLWEFDYAENYIEEP